MNYHYIKRLPSMDDIIRLYPLSENGHKKVMQDRQEIKHIMEGSDKRLLIIVGPCSAWPKPAVLEYAEKLLALNQAVSHSLKLVMRTYTQKPRTTKGWTGPLNQPDPFSDPDIEAGIHYTRDMMVKIVEMGLPIADECLFTHNGRGFSELVSWFAIGARSSEDHEHRIFASAADCAVGMKNPTHGKLDIAVNSVIAAQHSHLAAIDHHAVQTFGNPYAHLILRGSNLAPNYSLDNLLKIHELMVKNNVQNPSVLIDVSHDNCIINGKKEYRQQPITINQIMNYRKDNPIIKSLLKGLMIESFIEEGNQPLEQCTSESIKLNGLSITDACLGWKDTEELLLTLAESLQR